VVRSSHGAISLQVDEIEDVIELDAVSFEAPPPNVNPTLRALLAGVHKLQGRLLLVLDTERTVQTGT
jgi:purine-binding chemotaxis protein CheW